MWNELRKLTFEIERRWRCGIHRRNLVEQVGEPHEVGLVRHIRTPNGVVHQFIANRHFFGQSLFAIVHQSGTHMEILVECVIQVKSHKGFALHAESGLVFHRHANICTGIDDALVGDSHRTHIIVHRIVAVFCQGHATGCHHHRAARHIHGVEPDHITCRCLIFTSHHILILVGILTSHRQCAIVKFLIHIFVSNSTTAHRLFQVATKWLNNRENHPTL